MGRWDAPSDYDYAESVGDHVPRQQTSEKRHKCTRCGGKSDGTLCDGCWREAIQTQERKGAA